MGADRQLILTPSERPAYSTRRRHTLN